MTAYVSYISISASFVNLKRLANSYSPSQVSKALLTPESTFSNGHLVQSHNF